MNNDPVEKAMAEKEKSQKQYKALVLDREGAAEDYRKLKGKEKKTAMSNWMAASAKIIEMEEKMPWLKKPLTT